MESGYVNKELIDGVGEIEFFHPKSNSLPSDLLKDLQKAILDFSSDDAVKVILLKSAGEKAFCAGASFDELLSIQNEEDGKTFFSGFMNVILAIKNSPKFVVSKVQGKVVGGGVGIVCASDYALASIQASVKLSELAIGIGPFVIGPAVHRKLGVAKFSEFSINAKEWKRADWAQGAGMYAEVFGNQEGLDAGTDKLVKDLAAYSPEAMLELKKMLWKDTEGWELEMEKNAGISGKLVLSEFTRNELNAFKNK